MWEVHKKAGPRKKKAKRTGRGVRSRSSAGTGHKLSGEKARTSSRKGERGRDKEGGSQKRSADEKERDPVGADETLGPRAATLKKTFGRWP